MKAILVRERITKTITIDDELYIEENVEMGHLNKRERETYIPIHKYNECKGSLKDTLMMNSIMEVLNVGNNVKYKVVINCCYDIYDLAYVMDKYRKSEWGYRVFRGKSQIAFLTQVIIKGQEEEKVWLMVFLKIKE